MTNDTIPFAHLLRAADAEVLDGDPESAITLMADPQATAGLLTSNRSFMRAGSAGAPPHQHRDEPRSELTGEQMAEVLDGIPGAFERMQEARRQAERGEGIDLDDL